LNKEWVFARHNWSGFDAGTFGAVYHARNVDTGGWFSVSQTQYVSTTDAIVVMLAGEEVAIKLISLGDRFYRKYVEREILNHRQLMHPHIVAFKEVFVTSKVVLHC